jgi:hypothetical protein
MALKYELWGECKRTFGYEIRMDVTDDEGNIYNEVFHFSEGKPTEKTLNKEIQRRLNSIQDSIDNPPEPPKRYEDAIEALIEKGYLEEGQDLEDLPLKEIPKKEEVKL